MRLQQIAERKGSRVSCGVVEYTYEQMATRASEITGATRNVEQRLKLTVESSNFLVPRGCRQSRVKRRPWALVASGCKLYSRYSPAAIHELPARTCSFPWSFSKKTQRYERIPQDWCLTTIAHSKSTQIKRVARIFLVRRLPSIGERCKQRRSQQSQELD